MATWLSTHGIVAITDTKSSFIITAESGSALVKPGDPEQLTGWTAHVQEVAIYLANMQKFKQENLQRGQSFEEPIVGQQVVYNGKGIAVSIRLVFENMGSSLRFQSIAIKV
ncbi:hypothetical protein F4820DRAFT_453673 [Hypoxylon rubiginosum]|uniref:Uncharacterized protein n=1 Tax=Hypoxylon rubiginosum TaxID=110542 RepID=A0ACB9YJX1_9PEZI|nr:hypothetical protein F4820DRAFT_453673 [Hypoxylon rubiginosum]